MKCVISKFLRIGKTISFFPDFDSFSSKHFFPDFFMILPDCQVSGHPE